MCDKSKECKQREILLHAPMMQYVCVVSPLLRRPLFLFSRFLVVLAPYWKQLVNTVKSATAGGGRSNDASTAPSAPRFKTDQEKTEDLRRIRLLQQERAAKASAEAEKLRKEKEHEERMRRNMVAKKKHDQGGDRLGGGGSTSNSSKKKKSATSSTNTSTTTSRSRGDGYNPMNPWSASGGGGYKYVVCVSFCSNALATLPSLPPSFLTNLFYHSVFVSPTPCKRPARRGPSRG